MEKLDNDEANNEKKGNDLQSFHDVFIKGETVDVSSFSYLYYRYPGKENVTIPQPLTLFVGDDGHRVVDMSGGEHFMPNGFFHVKYKIKGEQKSTKILLEKK